MKKGKVFIFSAPSGSGKTTIVRKVLKSFGNFSFSISCTTRKRRGSEVSGVDYYFVSVEEFKQRIQNDEFIEYEEVYQDRFYGTLRSEVDRIIDKGTNALFDLDVMGGINLKKQLKDNACAIFIKPPSLEALKFRLRHRGTDNEEEIQKRLAKAGKEMSYADQFDHIVLNDDLESAVKEVFDIIKAFIQS